MHAALLHTPGNPDRAIEVAPLSPSADCPLVSCLMVSRGRLFPGRHAVECFLRQTHANRELVIVIDDPGCDLRAHVLALADPRLRLVEIPSGQRTLGELRNIAVANARGEYVCQWDDDDLYAPQRIEVQLATLVATGAAACRCGAGHSGGPRHAAWRYRAPAPGKVRSLPASATCRPIRRCGVAKTRK